VTGQIDNYDMKSGVVTDYKTASLWKFVYRDFSGCEKQGLVYAWLPRKNGFPVKKCRLVALLKDHSKTKARYGNGYPPSPVCVYEFDVTEDALRDIEEFIRDRLTVYTKASEVPDDMVPACLPEERWAEPEKYAVMKEGRKSAVKLFDSRDEAEAHAAGLGAKHRVETRRGSDRKCEDYCLCAKFCSYYRQNCGEREAAND
jgi:hypothetical protein